MIRTDDVAVFITSPDYKSTSGGIIALNRLANELVFLGCNVFLVANKSAPDARFRTLTFEHAYQKIAEYKSSNIRVIAVYPEIVVENILEADYVVWWLLNRPGFFHKNYDGSHSWADRVVCYDLVFGLDCRCDAKFMSPLYDVEYFRLNDNIEKTEVVLYVDRIIRYVEDVVPPVTPTMVLKKEFALSYKQLRDIFWKTKLLISYERSGTCAIAQLCGVPVVYMPSPILHESPDIRWGGYGSCFGYSDEGVAYASKTVYLLKYFHQDIEMLWPLQVERELSYWIKAVKSC